MKYLAAILLLTALVAVAFGQEFVDVLTPTSIDPVEAPVKQFVGGIPVNPTPPPAGPTTWDDLKNGGTTWDDLKNAGTTWNDLKGN